MALCGAIVFLSFGSFLVRCLTLASAVHLKCSHGLIFAWPSNGLNRITYFVCHADCPCEREFTLTAQTLFISAPFRLGRTSLSGEHKGFEVLNGPGAMLSPFLVLILLVFAVTCESHQRRAPKSLCVCVCLCVSVRLCLGPFFVSILSLISWLL